MGSSTKDPTTEVTAEERELWRSRAAVAHLGAHLDEESFATYIRLAYSACEPDLNADEMEDLVLWAINFWFAANFVCVPVDQITPEHRAAEGARALRSRARFHRVVPSLAASSRRPTCEKPPRRVRARGTERPAGKTKGAARRSSAKSGSSGDDGSDLADDPEPSPEPAQRRPCHCGCGNDLDAAGKRAGAKYLNDACTKRAAKARRAKAPTSKAERLTCLSCGCLLSRYGKGGMQCWSCAGLGDAEGGLYERGRPVVNEVLRRCGNYPARSSQGRSKVRAHAASLGIILSDTQAGALMGRYRDPLEALDCLAALASRRAPTNGVYSFAEHRAKVLGTPSEQLAALWRLPERQQSAAFRRCRAAIEAQRDSELAVAA